MDVRHGCHLLFVLIGSNPSVADVEVDAAVLICGYIGADANVGVGTCV